MHDARDAEDKRLLENGDHRRLVESYYETIIQWCTVRTRSRDAGVDVATNVVIRLLGELERGKTYTVPFRVVVSQVVRYKCIEYFAAKSDTLELDDREGPDPYDLVHERDAFDRLLNGLTDLEREIVTLRWWYGWEIEDIATHLGRTRNAIDQRISTASKKLRERVVR